MIVLRRLAGASLLVMAFAPVHRLLDPQATGPAGAATREAAETAWTLGLSGTVIVLTFAWVFTRMVPAGRTAESAFLGWTRRLERADGRFFAVATGAVATLLGLVVALTVHGGVPTSVDEMAQLLHARALRSGRLTIPLGESGAAWVVQNGVVTPDGWASIYPPFHTLLLAAGLGVGAPWLVGPASIGLATGLVTRSAERLVGVIPGRAAGLLLMVSPFWLMLGSTHSSHAPAAAMLALVLWTALRAGEGGRGWALAVGAAIGLAVTTRPWMGLACSLAIVLTVWAPSLQRGASGPGSRHTAPLASFARHSLAVLLGGAPFALLLFWWNATLYGDAFRLGYTAAFGSAHGLGFHVDPWGNRYGVAEAVAYTAADLQQLGIHLFESPLPAIALIGCALLLRPPRPGTGAFGAWAVAGVAANSVYWHHGIQFGPRMLFETLPAWVVLFTVAAASLISPSTAERGVERTAPGPRFTRWSVAVAIVAGLALAPSAVLRPGRSAQDVEMPALPGSPAVVFVHGSWASRISSRLAAMGMRRDSIETALRRNDICVLDQYTRWRGAKAAGEPPPLDLTPQSGTPPHLTSRALSRGNFVRVDPGSPTDARCAREAWSDRLGVRELEVLAWRYPHLSGHGVQAARDLGPTDNLGVLRSTDARAYVFIDGDDGPLLLEYAEGMELLWGGAAGDLTNR